MRTQSKKAVQRSIAKAEKRFDSYEKKVEAIRRSEMQGLSLSARFLELRIGDLFNRKAARH